MVYLAMVGMICQTQWRWSGCELGHPGVTKPPTGQSNTASPGLSLTPQAISANNNIGRIVNTETWYESVTNLSLRDLLEESTIILNIY